MHDRTKTPGGHEVRDREASWKEAPMWGELLLSAT